MLKRLVVSALVTTCGLTPGVIAKIPPYCQGNAASSPTPHTFPRPGYLDGYDPAKRKAIVFVHGLNGDAITTWQSEDGTYWPALLRRDALFDGYNIYVYEYPTAMFGNDCLPLPDVADDMNDRLRRVYAQHERVVLVAHSQGGIVTRNFLLT